MQHAHAVENLLPFLKPGSRVLDVGSGSGYLVALFHHLVSDAKHTFVNSMEGGGLSYVRSANPS